METTVCFMDEDAARQYDCGICLNKLENPVYIGCGSHFFCNECILTLLSHSASNQFPCPTCRSSCDRSQVNRIHAIDRQMQQLQVRCPNWQINASKQSWLGTQWTMLNQKQRKGMLDTLLKVQPTSSIKSRHRETSNTYNSPMALLADSDAGEDDEWMVTCRWTGDWGALQGHVAECPFQFMRCRYCSVGMLRAFMDYHYPICTEIPVCCTKCGQGDIPRSRLTAHSTQECPEELVKCEKCDHSVRRIQLKDHNLSRCPESKIRCEYWEYGCHPRIKRREETQHMKDHMVQHLHLVKEKCCRLVDDLNEVKEVMKDQQGMLEQQSEEHEEEMSDLRQKVMDQEQRMSELQSQLSEILQYQKTKNM